MHNRLPLFVGLLIVLAMLSYMFMFQVRYDQVAVLTTFDRAAPPQLDEAGVMTHPGGLRTEPGLYFRLPWPIQKVQHYSTRLRLLDHRLEQVSTSDGKSVAVRTYLMWQITDPLAFFVKLQDPGSAVMKLDPLISEEISGTIGRYGMNQLVNTDPEQVMLPQIESEALANLNRRLDTLGYGISAKRFGVRRIVLPQESTAKVFETMRKTRERLAANARSSGEAQASTIRSEAQATQKRILAFAERRAQALRAQGDKEAARYYTEFSKDEAFAIFLRRIETLKKVLPHNATFVLDSGQLSMDGLWGQGQTAPPPVEEDGGK